jgi:microcystin-dependent protein
MADPFVAEIRVVGFNFPPTGWAFCDGQLMPISQNTALFSLLGTTYGGNGQTTFALPDIQGRAVSHEGQGAGLTDYVQGEEDGAETITLVHSEMPFHTHAAQASSDPAELNNPGPDRCLARSSPTPAWQTDSTTNLVQLHPQNLSTTGGGLPHNNMPPVLVLNFIIALQGVFPQRP